MDRLASVFARHRRLVAACVVVYTAVCLFGVSRLTFDSDILRLLRSDRVELQWLGGPFGHLEQSLTIVVDGDDLLTQQAIQSIRDVVLRASEIEGVRRVHSLLDVRGPRKVGRYQLPLFRGEMKPAQFEQARRRALEHPLLIGHLLSEDLTTALLIVEIEGHAARIAPHDPTLDELHHLLDGRAADGNLRMRVTGPAALAREIVDTMRVDIARTSLLGMGVVALIATVLFRRPAAVILVSAGPVVGTIWTVGTFGLIGEPINVLTNIVPILVLIIGFTDSMHLVLHARRVVASGHPPADAAESAIRRLGLACALTSLSTAVGFGSLLVANLLIIKTFGWCCALGSVLSFLAVITVVPLLAGTRLSNHIVVEEKQREVGAHSWFDPWIALLTRRPRTILAGGILVTAAMVPVVTQIEPDYRIANDIPNFSDPYQALMRVDEEFGGVLFTYAVIGWPDGSGPQTAEFYDVLSGVHRVFDANHLVSNPLSFLNLVQTLPGDEPLARRAAQSRNLPADVVGRWISRSTRQALVSAHVPDVGGRRLNPAFTSIESGLTEIERRHEGFNIELTGAQVTIFRSIHLMIEDLWRSLLLASAFMFLMIYMGLRSWRLALCSVIPNVFPLLCAGSFIVLSGRYLEMSSVIVFSISLGIAVDDTIHFLVRYQREKESSPDTPSAVRQTFYIVGTALVMTTIALVAGHSVALFSAFPAIQTFAMITAISIAAALIGDLIILPALLLSTSRLPTKSRQGFPTATRVAQQEPGLTGKPVVRDAEL